MDSKNGLIPFGLLVLILVFSFIFCLDSLSASNTTYLVLALVGFVVSLFASLLLGLFARRDGEAIAIWYNSYLVIVGIVFIWYLTRVGAHYQLW